MTKINTSLNTETRPIQLGGSTTNASITDVNGNIALNIVPTSSAVNYITLTNAASGNFPIISAGSPNGNTGLTFVDSSALTLLTLRSDTGNSVNYPIMSAQNSGVPANIVGSTTDGLALKDSSLSSSIQVNSNFCSMNSGADSVTIGLGSASVTGGSSAVLSVNLYGGVSIDSGETILYGPGGFSSTSIVLDSSNQLVMNLNGASYYIIFPAVQGSANSTFLNDGAGNLSFGFPPMLGGGTGAAITASNGGIFYSGATTGDLLAGTATAQKLLMSGASSAPIWSTSTYPTTNAVNTLLYASSANVMAALATANSSVLTTNGSGVPAWNAYTVVSPIQYVQVALSSANILGMYATPVQMIATPGSGFMIVIVNASMETLPSGTAYLLGGPVTLQYGNTNHGGGDSATGGTLAAADILGATSTLYTFPLPATSSAYVIATDSNKGIFISNSVAAFTTGTGTAKINITYYVIAV